MEDLFIATSFLGIQRVIEILLSLIRVKVSAIYLNPSGVGIVSQLGNFKGFIQQFINLGVGSGITKYVAEYRGNQDTKSLQKLLYTVTTLFLITGGIGIVIFILLSPVLAEAVLADRKKSLFIILIGAAVPIAAQFEVISRFLQGLLKVRALAVLSIVSSALSLAITVPLIMQENLFGAILSIPISGLISFGIGQIYLHRIFLREYGIKLRLMVPDKEILFNLAKFGGSRGVISIVQSLTILTIRRVIIGQLGTSSNGLYQVAYTVSNNYLGIIFTSIWLFGMPKSATMVNNDQEVIKFQNNAARLLLVILMPLISVILISRELWIPILYSVSFLSAAELLGWQLVGDLIRALGWTPKFTLITKEHFGFLIYSQLVHFGSQLGLFLLLFPRLGLISAPIAYAASYFVLTLITLIRQKIVEGFSYSERNWKLFFASAGFLLAVLGLNYYFREELVWRLGLYSVFFCGWAVYVVDKVEVKRISQIVRNYIRGQYPTNNSENDDLMN